ncbi:MAG: SPFH domain-containing protein [Candidatus Caenarcaniphilales bacterium]|nr:SPFH domain-containing protein [Candidatus Caenarcaniphilales bacterium]
MNNNNSKLAYIIGGVIFLFLFFAWINPIFVVQPGVRAIIFNKISGLGDTVYGEGLKFKQPFFDDVIFYSVVRQPFDVETTAASKDLQNVKVKLRFLYSPKEDKIPLIHKELRQGYADTVFPSITREVLKAVIAKKTAEEIVTQREEVSRLIRDSITQRAKDFNINIYDVALAEVEFSPTFTEAIERKQVAQQDLEASRKKAEAAIVKARGEAEAARIINEASRSSPAFIELRRIEAQKDIAATLARSSNVTYLPSNTLLNLKSK